MRVRNALCLRPSSLGLRPSATRATSKRLLVAAAVVLLVTSCRQQATGAPLPPGRPVVDLVMREYAFDYATPVPSGQVLFKVVNAGRVNHRLILVPLPEDAPPLDEQMHSTEGRVVTPLVGIPDRPPGAEDSFAVFLPPGRYGLVCFTRTEEGIPHAHKGMLSEFRVGD